MAPDCSSCVQNTSGYPCGWCGNPTSKCSITEECSVSTSVPALLTMGRQCPDPTITSIFPTSGPSYGGTIITIIGTDLGVTINDFNADNSIKIGGMACIPLSRDYISGRQILCETQNTTELGRVKLVVNLTRLSGIVTATANTLFNVIEPNVTSVEPTYGPIAGGSVLTIRGTDLNIGNSARVTLYGYDGPRCNIMYVV